MKRISKVNKFEDEFHRRRRVLCDPGSPQEYATTINDFSLSVFGLFKLHWK